MNDLVQLRPVESKCDIVENPVGRKYCKYDVDPKKSMKGYTFVISVVAASISRSSAVRSAKPGRACFAWSFSRATTKEKK
jgi:hypothetical protein